MLRVHCRYCEDWVGFHESHPISIKTKDGRQVKMPYYFCGRCMLPLSPVLRRNLVIIDLETLYKHYNVEEDGQ
jgi:hypothetical protein